MAADEAQVSAVRAAVRDIGLPAAASGAGAFAAIFALASLSDSLGAVLLIAPFGASCVLLFALPLSPLARPRNVIGGHFLSALVGLAVLGTFGKSALALGVAVGLAIMVMRITHTLHPPAGANPIIVLASEAEWSFLWTPVLAGATALVAAAFAYHRWVSKQAYPLGVAELRRSS